MFRRGPLTSSPTSRTKNNADIKFNADADEEQNYAIEKKSSSPKMKNQIKCQVNYSKKCFDCLPNAFLNWNSMKERKGG